MGLWDRSPLVRPIYTREGLGGNDLRAAPPPSRRPSLYLSAAAHAVRAVLAHRRPAFHPRTCGLRGGAVAIADRLLGSSTRSSVRGTWSTTSSTSTRDFFRCAARLVVTIYDLLLASILGLCGSDASVAYPFTYSMHSGKENRWLCCQMSELLAEILKKSLKRQAGDLSYQFCSLYRIVLFLQVCFLSMQIFAKCAQIYIIFTFWIIK